MMVAGSALLLAVACTGTIKGAATPWSSPDVNVGGAAGTGGGGAAGQAHEACPLVPRRLWKLTPRQIANTLSRLLGDEVKVSPLLTSTLSLENRRFANEAHHLDLVDSHVEALFDALEPVAAELVARSPQAQACKNVGLGEITTCADAFFAQLLPRAFRRTVPEEEREPFVAMANELAPEQGAAGALAHVVAGALMSPHFLFRSELGAAGEGDGESGRLTSFEIASAISYFLTDGPPDDELWQAAQQGKLSTKAEIAAHVDRLFKAQTAVGVREMILEMYHVDHVLEIGKDAELYPDYSDATARAMRNQVGAFVERVLWASDGHLDTLLGANFTVVDAEVAPLYDLPAPKHGWALVSLPPERPGLLTHPALMAALARSDESDIVERGKFIREELLCQTVPAPPDDVSAMFPEDDTSMLTQREALETVHSKGGCAACHIFMDPLGYPFEIFDAIGRVRARDKGKPIRTDGELTGTSNDGPFADVKGLVQRLQATKEVPACFASRIYQYAMGLPRAGIPACALEPLVDKFDGDVKAFVVDLVTSQPFLHRR